MVWFAATATLIWLVLSLWQQQGRLLSRLEKLEAAPVTSGTKERTSISPNLQVNNLEGYLRPLKHYLSNAGSNLLLFLHPGCGPCKELAQEAINWHKAYRERLPIIFVSSGEEEETRALLAAIPATSILRIDHEELARSFGIEGTPSAVLVQHDGKVTDKASGSAAIERLIITCVNDARDTRPIAMKQVVKAALG
jgi:thiol-disulfide isomerase/thioredoxin